MAPTGSIGGLVCRICTVGSRAIRVPARQRCFSVIRSSDGAVVDEELPASVRSRLRARIHTRWSVPTRAHGWQPGPTLDRLGYHPAAAKNADAFGAATG